MSTWGLLFTSPDLHRWSGKMTGLEEQAFCLNLPPVIKHGHLLALSTQLFGHWVPLGGWDMSDFFPEIFAEALVIFTMSALGPLYLGGRTFSKS